MISVPQKAACCRGLFPQQFYLRDDKPIRPFPNHWDLIGGHVEVGETPEQALRQEVREEIGFRLTAWRLFRRYQCLTGYAYPI